MSYRVSYNLLFAVAVIGSAAGADASGLDVGPADAISSWMVLADEDLHIVSPGPLTIRGDIIALAGADAQSPTPNIVIEVDGVLVLDGAIIRGAHGRDGATASGTGFAVGGDGASGGNIRIRALKIIARDAFIFAGDGGRGGDAFAIGAPNAEARAGNGGAGGVVEIEGIVEGVLTTHGGRGGDGGEGVAEGEGGEDCMSVAGRGEESDERGPTPITGHGKSAAASGTDGKCGPVDGEGGKGGDAIAYGGSGGIAMDGSGGNGGDATARAGRGGDGMDACYTDAALARASGTVNAGKGGTAGAIVAVGGHGGTGTVGGRGGSGVGSGDGGRGGNATGPIVPGGGGATTPHRGYSVESRVVGGDGGTGLAGAGGGGGNASILGDGGAGGSHCGPLEFKGLDVPAPASVLAAFVAVAVALLTRRVAPPAR